MNSDIKRESDRMAEIIHMLEKIEKISSGKTESNKCRGHLKMISNEYRAAVKKHPVFAEKFDNAQLEEISKNLAEVREENEKKPYIAMIILVEEMYETIEAYHKGEKKHCLQELAQCGAVILRMMNFVERKMK